MTKQPMTVGTEEEHELKRKPPVTVHVTLSPQSPGDLVPVRSGEQPWRHVVDPRTGMFDERLDRTSSLEFDRKGWDRPETFRLCDQNRLFNVAGLYWRPVP